MKSILVVDDEPHATRVMKLGLERAGYEVQTAWNGEQALEKLMSHPFDALVTDIKMPRMTGRDLCEQIREKFPDRNFFIFIITCSSSDEHRKWAQNLPESEFLEKPLSLQHLIARLKHHLRQEPGNRE